MSISHSFYRRPAFRSITFCLMTCCAVAIADENDAVGPSAKDTPGGTVVKVDVANVDIPKLIKRLGAAQYVVREDATMKLFETGSGKQGNDVLQALENAATHRDREIRERSKRILVLLKGNRQVERVASFLRGEEVAGVPGWTKFSEQFGDTKITRAVYGEMLKDEWKLLTTCFADDKEVPPPTAYVATTKRLAEAASPDYGYQPISLGSSLSYFYISSEFPGDFRLQNTLFQLIRSSTALSQRLRGPVKPADTFNGLVRKIVGQWIVATVEHDVQHASMALTTTVGVRLFPEAKLVSAHVLNSAKSLPVNKQLAMLTFAGLKDKKGIPLIEPYLQDDTKLRNGPRLQLRDVALTCLMDLHGHDVTRIGVTRQNNERTPYNYSTLGFNSDKERQAAFDLYEELQAEKKLRERRAKKAAEEQKDTP